MNLLRVSFYTALICAAAVAHAPARVEAQHTRNTFAAALEARGRTTLETTIAPPLYARVAGGRSLGDASISNYQSFPCQKYTPGGYKTACDYYLTAQFTDLEITDPKPGSATFGVTFMDRAEALTWADSMWVHLGHPRPADTDFLEVDDFKDTVDSFLGTGTMFVQFSVVLPSLELGGDFSVKADRMSDPEGPRFLSQDRFTGFATNFGPDHATLSGTFGYKGLNAVVTAAVSIANKNGKAEVSLDRVVHLHVGTQTRTSANAFAFNDQSHYPDVSIRDYSLDGGDFGWVDDVAKGNVPIFSKVIETFVWVGLLKFVEPKLEARGKLSSGDVSDVLVDLLDQSINSLVGFEPVPLSFVSPANGSTISGTATFAVDKAFVSAGRLVVNVSSNVSMPVTNSRPQFPATATMKLVPSEWWWSESTVAFAPAYVSNLVAHLARAGMFDATVSATASGTTVSGPLFATGQIQTQFDAAHGRGRFSVTVPVTGTVTARTGSVSASRTITASVTAQGLFNDPCSPGLDFALERIVVSSLSGTGTSSVDNALRTAFNDRLVNAVRVPWWAWFTSGQTTRSVPVLSPVGPEGLGLYAAGVRNTANDMTFGLRTEQPTQSQTPVCESPLETIAKALVPVSAVLAPKPGWVDPNPALLVDLRTRFEALVSAGMFAASVTLDPSASLLSAPTTVRVRAAGPVTVTALARSVTGVFPLEVRIPIVADIEMRPPFLPMLSFRALTADLVLPYNALGTPAAIADVRPAVGATLRNVRLPATAGVLSAELGRALNAAVVLGNLTHVVR